jgi:hypothetical protein
VPLGPSIRGASAFTSRNDSLRATPELHGRRRGVDDVAAEAGLPADEQAPELDAAEGGVHPLAKAMMR